MASEQEDIFREFGHQLQEARLAQSRSLDDLASYTKIHRRHLEAIEAGDISQLPQGPYVKAFLREYARALGLKVPEAYTTPPPPAAADPRVVSRPAPPSAGGSAGEDSMLPLTAVAKETVRFANTAVNSAVSAVSKTTESMVKFVETGSKEALEMLTSKSLWDEADEVRRERLGLPPIPKTPEAQPTKKVVITSAAPQPVRAPEQSRTEEVAVSDAALAESTATETSSAELETAPKRTVSSKGATNVVIALLVILFGGAAFYAIRMYRSEGTPSGAISKDYIPAPVDKPQVLAPTKHPATVTQPAEQPAAVVGPNDSLRFTLRATQPVWISIAPDGLPAYKGELRAGDVKTFKAGERFIVNLGNQKAVEMNFNGQALSGLPTIQNSGVVVRNLILMRNHVTLSGQEVTLGPPPGQAPPPQSAPLVSTPQVTPSNPAPHPTNVSTPGTSVKKPGSTVKKPGSGVNRPGYVGATPQKTPSVKKPATQKTHVLKPGEIPSIDPVPARP